MLIEYVRTVGCNEAGFWLFIIIISGTGKPGFYLSVMEIGAFAYILFKFSACFVHRYKQGDLLDLGDLSLFLEGFQVGTNMDVYEGVA